jgi:hypothetical protein
MAHYLLSLLFYQGVSQPKRNARAFQTDILPKMGVVLINQMRRAVIVLKFTPLRNWNLEQFIEKPNALKSRNEKNQEKAWVSYHMAGFNYHF